MILDNTELRLEISSPDCGLEPPWQVAQFVVVPAEARVEKLGFATEQDIVVPALVFTD